MKLYIISSWKNKYAVEMFTEAFRNLGHIVSSFVENSHDENTWYDPDGKVNDKSLDGTTEDEASWINSIHGERCFNFDTISVMESDAVLYIGPSGCDAWAEVGLAWGHKIPIFGLWAKGDKVGLMRRMVERWYTNSEELLIAITRYSDQPIK